MSAPKGHSVLVPDLRERRYLDRSRGEIMLLVVFAAMLATGAVAGVAWAAGLDAVRDRLVHPDLLWLPVAAAVLLPAYMGYIAAYRAVTEVEGERPLDWRATAAVVATGFGVFHVRGGFGVDLEAMHQSCDSPAEARSRVLGLGALEYAVLAPAASIAAMLVLAEGTRISWGMTLPWAIAVPLGFLFGFAALRHHGRFHRRGGLAGAIAGALHGVDILRRLAFTSPRVAISAYAGMTLYWAAEIFALWAMLHAFLGHAPNWPSVIVGYATGYALTRRTLPLAGAGVVEALLPFALSWMSYPLAAAVVAVGAYRIVNLWLPLVPALAGLRAERRARLVM
ncbi:MAG TPA: lysylphosphatidylglycerol synthase domain-containing protein [Gaiellaceae bacterium]|jgi:uncharacterized membrane protein YbhN (UPF0104 family)|nr:lysylphosphatidylglycerol synthase domain-containing protein [Gaiellaceae bacterium]